MCKKILFVVPDAVPGGVTTSLKNWCELLNNKGYHVAFLNMSKKNDSLAEMSVNIEQISLKGIAKLWQLGNQDIKLEKNYIYKILMCVIGIIKKLTIRSGAWYHFIFSFMKKIEGYDVVCAFRQCEPCYFFALNKVNAKTKIGFVHGELAAMGDISSWDRYFDQFDSIACVSDYVRQEFANQYLASQKKFKCVYNAFNINKIIEKSKQKSIFDFNNNVVNFISLSRIEDATKNINYIPYVCKKLVQRGCKNFHWYIVGDGPDLEKNKHLAEELHIKEYVTFSGYCENPFPLLKNAELCVVTSSTEAYSMTVRESHILGVPVLSTNYATSYEAIIHLENGYIVDKNVDSIVNAIIFLLKDDEKELKILHGKTNKCKITNDEAYSQMISLFSESERSI